VIFSPAPTLRSPGPFLSWDTSSSSEVSRGLSRAVPFLDVNMTCICRKVIWLVSGSSRSSLNKSWKCVATSTLGQLSPRCKKCLSTPQRSPAPSKKVAREWPRGERPDIAKPAEPEFKRGQCQFPEMLQRESRGERVLRACGDRSLPKLIQKHQGTSSGVTQCK
jgi:hypothetical protein